MTDPGGSRAAPSGVPEARRQVLRRHADAWLGGPALRWLLESFETTASERVCRSTDGGTAQRVARGSWSVPTVLAARYDGSQASSGTASAASSVSSWAARCSLSSARAGLAASRHPKAWMYVAVNHERRAFMASAWQPEYAFMPPCAQARTPKTGPRRTRDAYSLRRWRRAADRDPVDGHRSSRARRAAFDTAGCSSPATRTCSHPRAAWLQHRGRDAEPGLEVGRQPVRPGGSTLLDSYEVERKRLAERNTAYARRFADSVGLFVAKPELEEDSPRGELERRLAAEHLDEHVRLEFNIPGVTFGGRYDGSPVIFGDGSVPPPDGANAYTPTASPGGRPPHTWLDDGRSLFDLFHREWTLLALGPDTPITAALKTRRTRCAGPARLAAASTFAVGTVRGATGVDPA